MHEEDPFSEPAAELRAEAYALGGVGSQDGEDAYASSTRSDAWAAARDAWGAVQNAAQQTADAARCAVGYLRTHRRDEITEDAIRMARERPVETLAGAAALGFLVGAVLSLAGRR